MPKAPLGLDWGSSCRVPGTPIARESMASCVELPGQAATGTLWQAPAWRQEGDLGLEGTAGGWEGEGEKQEEGQSQSLQQAQNWGCISEGGRWQSREAQGSRPQLSLPRWLESWKGGWKLTQGLGVRTGPSQTLKRDVERRSGATPPLPLPSPRQTSLIERKLSDRHQLGLRCPFPRTPGQTSDPLNSLR